MKKVHNSLFSRALEKLTSLSYHQLFAIWASLAIAFALGYFLFASIGDVSHHGPAELVGIQNSFIRFCNSLYYSVITATSTGYGDITPRGLSKALAAMQSISALFVFAVFVTKLVSQHQEIALREVHRMTFEDVFHNIREGLYIVRKDLDGLILQAKEQKKLDEEDWETLVIAYKQTQSLISEIPDFYNDDNTLYTIDRRREELLHEAVHRTLHRLNTLLDTLSQADVAWEQQDRVNQELQECICVVERTLPRWQDKSPYDRAEAFVDIAKIKDRMTAKMQKIV